MTAGDVVNGISSANTTLDFQPAAGVECVITSVGREATNTGFGLYDGTTLASDTPAANLNTRKMKLWINNTRYFRIEATGAATNGSYTGIQTK